MNKYANQLLPDVFDFFKLADVHEYRNRNVYTQRVYMYGATLEQKCYCGVRIWNYVFDNVHSNFVIGWFKKYIQRLFLFSNGDLFVRFSNILVH